MSFSSLLCEKENHSKVLYFSNLTDILFLYPEETRWIIASCPILPGSVGFIFPISSWFTIRWLQKKPKINDILDAYLVR